MTVPLPKDVYVLRLRTCDYVMLHDERGFADVIKGMHLEIGRSSWIIVSHRTFKAGTFSWLKSEK